MLTLEKRAGVLAHLNKLLMGGREAPSIGKGVAIGGGVGSVLGGAGGGATGKTLIDILLGSGAGTATGAGLGGLIQARRKANFINELRHRQQLLATIGTSSAALAAISGSAAHAHRNMRKLLPEKSR